MSLALCTSCRRHVRVDEASCPFCGGNLADSVSRAVPRAPRAAILFGSALIIAGCSGSDHTNVAPPYGAPYDAARSDTPSDTNQADSSPTDTAPADSAALDTATDDGSLADTADTADTASGDTAETDTGGAVPPYGAPFLEDTGSDEK